MTTEARYSASYIRSLPKAEATRIIQSLSNEEALRISYDWHFWARDEQIAPWRQGIDARQWVIKSGRGWGKTRSGSEEIIEYAKDPDFEQSLIATPTKADYRDVNVNGPGGIVKSSPPWFKPTYLESKAQVVWPNKHVTLLRSSDEPERFRGPEFGFIWADEVMAWKKSLYCYELMMMSLRHGAARFMATFTPPRKERKGEVNFMDARELLKKLLALPHVHLTEGSSHENRENLSPEYYRDNIAPYEGTRAGRTEIYGDFLLDAEFALWTTATIDASRVPTAPELGIICVGVDPATGGGETGIVVSGKSLKRYDIYMNEAGRGKHHYFTLADYTTSGRPEKWARIAVQAYYDHNAHYIAIEDNQGGTMTESTIKAQDPRVPVKRVRATEGKHIRAEPVALKTEKGEHHFVGHFHEMEAECTGWEPGDPKSPNRLDALVHSVVGAEKGLLPVVQVGIV